MNDVSPIGRPSSPAALSRAERMPPRASQAIGYARGGRDQVELSRTAQLLSKIHELPAIRQDMVDRVRAQIEDGIYDTPERLDATIQRLMEEEGLG